MEEVAQAKGMTTPNGTSITLTPPTAITDEQGGVWTLDTDGTVLLNGVQAGNGVGFVIGKSAGKIFVLGNDRQTWWEWIGSGYAFGGNSPPAGLSIPPGTPATLPTPVPPRLLKLQPNNPAFNVEPLNGFPPTLTAFAIADDGQPIADDEYVWSIPGLQPFVGRVWIPALPAPGEYTATLTVLNGMFQRSFPAGLVQNQLPVAKWKATASGLFVTYDASESFDPDGTIVQVRWTLPETIGQVVDAVVGKVVNKQYSSPGPKTYVLELVDNGGGVTRRGEFITLAGPIPVPAPVPGPNNPLGLTTREGVQNI